jgi:hypothetical protein
MAMTVTRTSQRNFRRTSGRFISAATSGRNPGGGNAGHPMAAAPKSADISLNAPSGSG